MGGCMILIYILTIVLSLRGLWWGDMKGFLPSYRATGTMYASDNGSGSRSHRAFGRARIRSNPHVLYGEHLLRFITLYKPPNCPVKGAVGLRLGYLCFLEIRLLVRLVEAQETD